MKAWKNKYSGSCWVVGNGPSMRVDDIDGYSIACNRIALVYNETSWRPSFFYAHAPMYSYGWLMDVIRSIELGIPCFIHERLKNLGNYPNITWIPDGIYHGLSGLTMTKLAQYLGFTDIQFTGMDGNWQALDGDDVNHFHREYLREVSETQAERWNHAHNNFMKYVEENL
jgi:hypothetical protein